MYLYNLSLAVNWISRSDEKVKYGKHFSNEVTDGINEARLPPGQSRSYLNLTKRPAGRSGENPNQNFSFLLGYDENNII